MFLLLFIVFIRRVIESGTFWESVSAGATIGLLAAAIVAGIFAYKSFRKASEQSETLSQEAERNTFSAIIKEISSTAASLDRGILFRDITSEQSVGNIRDKIEEGRKLNRRLLEQGKGYSLHAGAAGERTIARYDRVGFFLFPNENQTKPVIEPPLWLWTHVINIWDRLGKWVKHRQNKREAEEEYYHPYYGFYLERLYNEAESRKGELKL